MRNSFLLSSLAALFMFTAVACGDDDDDDDDVIDSGTPTIDGSEVALSCATYCTDIAANCTGDTLAQFGPAGCAETCDSWDEGVYMVAGNTLGCHQYHAGAAEGDPGVHCIHAGPTGGGVCGTDVCAAFCDLVEAACGTFDPLPYADNAECLSECAKFTPGDYVGPASAGDSLACRFYHATAATAAPTPHCGHVGAATGKGLPCSD
jgi:hypothetical protein